MRYDAPMSWEQAKPWLRRGGLLLGVALLAAAVGYALWGVNLSVLRQADPFWLLLLAVGVFINLLLTGLLFWVITLSFDAQPKVTLTKMLQLVSASALINYLPLGWPGPMARSAYLKTKHNLPVRQSLLVLFIVLGMSALSALLALLLVLGRDQVWLHLFMGALLLALCVINTPVMKFLLRRSIVVGWSWWPIKWADMLINALRLWLAFQIVGSPIAFIDALALAGIDMVISMLAITPSGLGVSEWVIGLCSQWLTIAQGPVGVLAKLVDRAVNVLVTVLVGLFCARGLFPKDLTPSPSGPDVFTTHKK